MLAGLPQGLVLVSVSHAHRLCPGGGALPVPLPTVGNFGEWEWGASTLQVTLEGGSGEIPLGGQFWGTGYQG